MHYSQIVVLVSALIASGCSSETPNSPATPTPSNTQSTDASDADSARGTKPADVASSPKYEAVIVINAAKKGEDGPSCTSDMTAKGKSKCGPDSSLTELSWEFTEHRDGVDYYKFNWNLTRDGETKNGKDLTVGFDGNTETTVIDAEHYIIIRKGPLSSNSEEAK